MEREQRRVDLDREVLPPAERAADAGEVDTHPIGLQPEARRHLVTVDVRPLGRDVDVDASLAVRNRKAGLGAEERLVLRADLVDAGHGDVALRLGIAVADHDRADDVRARIVAVPVPHRRSIRMERLLLGRALRIAHGIERRVFDADSIGGTSRLLRVVGGDDRHRLAEVADTVDREHGLVGKLEAVRLPAAGRRRA